MDSLKLPYWPTNSLKNAWPNTKYGYFELPHTHTPGLWKHVTRPIALTLVVDNFGIKYVGKEHLDLDHLLTAIKEDYTVDVNMTGGFMLVST